MNNRKLKILLISPTWSIPSGYEDRIRIPYPVGLIQIAAVLEQKGMTVKIIDALAENWKNKKEREGIITIGLDDDELVKRIKELNPDYIGIGLLFTSQRDNLIRISKRIKQEFDIPLIAGGVDPSIEFEECLNSCPIDYIVVGEADFSFLELIIAIENRKNIDKILGIAYLKDNKVVFTGKREVISDLNILPMPAYHLLNFENYFEAGESGFSSRGITIKKWMSIFTSRGCPYQCSFCAIHLISGRRWRGKSADKVVAEIEYLYQKYGINYFFFEDDNLTADIKRAEAIFDGIINKGMRIIWETPNGIRADIMTPALARKMRLSGCKKLIFGIENGDSEFLQNVIHKNLDLKKVIVATKIIKKEKIELAGFFIIGIPGETKKIMIKSIFFAMKLARLGMVPGFTLATPLPKTEMFEYAKQKGYILKNPITPKDYLISYSEPLMTTEHFTYKQLMYWKRIATILTVFTLFLFNTRELLKTNTIQEIRKHPLSIFRKINSVIRGST